MSAEDEIAGDENSSSDLPESDGPLERMQTFEFADAMILGDVSIQSDAFEMMEGTHVDDEGQINNCLLYSAGGTARAISPDSILVCREDAVLQAHRLTPYERFLYEMLDGVLDARDLCESTGLAKNEVMSTLLTLTDKGLIRVLKDEKDVTNSQVGTPRPVRIDRTVSVLDEDLSAKVIENIETIAGPLPIRASSTQVDERAGQSPEDPDSANSTSLTDETEELVLGLATLSQSTGSLPGGRYSADSSDELEAETLHAPIQAPALSQPTEDLDQKTSHAIDTASKSIGDSAKGLGIGTSTEFDFGEKEEDLSLSLGLPEDSEMYSDLELQESLELDLNNLPSRSERLPSSAFLEQLPSASTGLLNDAIAEAVNELANEFAEASPVLKPSFAEDDSEELALSDAFQSLENALDDKNWPTSKAKKDQSSVVRLGSSCIKALPEQEYESTHRPPAKTNAPKPSRQPRGMVKELDRRREPNGVGNLNAKKEPSHFKKNKDLQQKLKSPSGAGLARADKLFQEALSDKAGGNYVAARMNVKLALTFDATNSVYLELLETLSKKMPNDGPQSSLAMQQYERATAAEKAGNIDQAIAALYKALSFAKDAPIYNRLGVMLAMKKTEFKEARKMIETAISLDPSNPRYQHNLQKVLTMQASLEVDSQKVSAKSKKGILGFLSRKKKR